LVATILLVLMLAAQGYQESQLNQAARSLVGAIGIMQRILATGAAMEVGDIVLAEPNVRAGAKYMNQFMIDYFSDASLTEPTTGTLRACKLQRWPRQHLAHAQGGQEPWV
jgi:membrane-bound lytic murein transglycosylase MltF